MNFSTDLFKLLPKRFREGVGKAVWKDLFTAFGTIMNTVHEDIDGLADLNDKDRVPAEYMVYLAEMFGFQLVVTPGVPTEERRRIFLKAITWIVNHKGTKQLLLDLAHFLYFVAYPGATLQLFDLWTSDYTNFSIDKLELTMTPVGWTGDGVTTSFSTTLVAIPVRVRSVKITTKDEAGADLEAWDDGKGVIKGDVDGIGTIDYTSGAISMVWSSAPGLHEDISIKYTFEAGQYLSPHYLAAFTISIYQDMGLVEEEIVPSGWVGDGVVENFVTILPKVPIGTESITITAVDSSDNVMTVTDDGLGILEGDVGTGTNTIDYEAGGLDVTFSAPVKTGTNVTVTYSYKDIFVGRARVASMLDYLDRFKPVQAVRRLSIGQADDFWRVEHTHWRVGGPSLPLSETIRVGGIIWS